MTPRSGVTLQRTQFAMRLDEALDAAGISMRELGRRTGMDPANIRRLRAGAHVPSLSTLRRLGDALGVPWHVLVS